jgi:hypothetical protein
MLSGVPKICFQYGLIYRHVESSIPPPELWLENKNDFAANKSQPTFAQRDAVNPLPAFVEIPRPLPINQMILFHRFMPQPSKPNLQGFRNRTESARELTFNVFSPLFADRLVGCLTDACFATKGPEAASTFGAHGFTGEKTLGHSESQ